MSRELYEALQRKGFVSDKLYALLTTHEVDYLNEIYEEMVEPWGTAGENEKLLHEECHKLARKKHGWDHACEIWFVESEDGYECLVIEFPAPYGNMLMERARGEIKANRTEAIASLLKVLKE